MSLVNRLWSLKEGTVSSNTEDAHLRKVWFALKTWRAKYNDLKSRLDGKNGDIKDMKSDMYQLIGFFSVFQGVLFQGVTSFTNGCEFRFIPMALAVATTLGTIFGVYHKFSDLLDIQDRRNGDAVSIKVLLYYINEIERLGKDFSFEAPVDQSANSSMAVETKWKLQKQHNVDVSKRQARLKKELENSNRLKYAILAYLFLIGGAFTYILSVMMCRQY